MIAEKGKTYAQIRHGKCHWIFTTDDLPEWNDEQCPAVDVTGNEPAVGDIWNGAGFEALPLPPPPSPEQQALIDAKAEIRADTKFQNLINKTPQQAKNWVENNFPSLTLPEQRDLATIVMAVGILGRRL